MNALMSVFAVTALTGSALIGGVFFVFSSFIMKSLSRLPSSEGIAAMQSINVVVLNRSFLGVFMGTAVISSVFIVRSLFQWGTVAAMWFLCGGILYVVGTFLVTIAGNVPLNDRLAAVSAPDPSSALLWEHYLERWTFFNTLRTAAAIAAALFFTLGLLGESHVGS